MTAEVARRSLVDGVDLAAVRAGAATRAGPFAAAVACLLDGVVLQHDPADPAWVDRDRLVAGGAAPVEALDEGDPGDRVVAALALPRAVEAAQASAAAGGIYRVWCLLDEEAAEAGGTWEAARAAAASACGELATVCRGALLGDLLALAGWRVLPAAAGEVLAVLGAMDRAMARRQGPVAIALR